MPSELTRRRQVGEVRLRPRLLGTGSRQASSGRAAELQKGRADGGLRPPSTGRPGRKLKFLKATAAGVIASPNYVRLENLEQLNKLKTKVSGAYRAAGHQRGGLLHLLLDGRAASIRFWWPLRFL